MILLFDSRNLFLKRIDLLKCDILVFQLFYYLILLLLKALFVYLLILINFHDCLSA